MLAPLGAGADILCEDLCFPGFVECVVCFGVFLVVVILWMLHFAARFDLPTARRRRHRGL